MYVHPDANEIYLQGHTAAILCIHGFTGHPGEFRYLAQDLHRSGYTVSVPRLPGHGTTGKDFLQSHWSEWLLQARKEYDRLRSQYNKVYVVGLSMGGLIACILSDEHPPHGLVLCAPAFKIRIPGIHIAKFVGRLIGKIPRISAFNFIRNSKKTHFEREYQQYYWPKHAGYLLTLIRKADKVLRQIKVPCLSILAANDKVVSLSTLPYIREKLPHSQILLLKKSAHVVVNDVEKELASTSIKKFLIDILD